MTADLPKPAILRAFRRTETPLSGKFVKLPWQSNWHDAGNLIPNSDIGFTGFTTGIGILIGKLPQSKPLRIQGSYGTPGGIEQSCLGDGVVIINGKEVLRIPPGKPPYQMHDFDLDISSFSGQFVMLEFWSDGNIGGVAPLMQWNDPRIVESH